MMFQHRTSLVLRPVRHFNMGTLEQARTKILTQITSDDSNVRADYLKHFQSEIETIASAMAEAVINWQSLHADVKDDENFCFVSAWVITAISLHILSTKLFVSGHTVAAGNLFRQVVETIALALLCSAKLDLIDKVRNNKYSTNNAVKDLLRQAK